ncbi:GNAT family N-acetyltransferase [Mycoplasmatota bacterium]|nr:GNAT family N-acetyltransferase [Mycoplasmatota bacterium]
MSSLKTDRLLLRSLSIQDSDRIEELAGEYDVAKTTLNIPHPYPKGSAKEFINGVLNAEESGKVVIFAITEKTTHDLVGIMSIQFSNIHKRGELAYWVGKPYWGIGYGTEAAKSILSYGFEELKLNKIYAQAFTANPGSWRVMEKIGLKYEGTLKQHVFRFGKFYDLVCYGLTSDAYLKK